MEKKILITGCGGFIGSHLAEYFIKKGEEVHGVENLEHIYNMTEREDFLYKLVNEHKNFKLFNELPTEKELKEYHIIYHLAAIPGVRNSFYYYPKFILNNIKFTQDILERCRFNHRQKIVIASSSSVYGNYDGEMKESLRVRPYSPYAMTKVACENLADIYKQNYNMDIMCLRFFTVYGKRQRPDLLIHKAIEAAYTGESLDIWGNGEQKRDFTYIDDIIRGITLVSYHVKNCSNDIINIGSTNPVSINFVLDKIEELTEKKINRFYQNKQQGDVKNTFANIEKLKILGYSPKININEGLKRQIEWQKGNR